MIFDTPNGVTVKQDFPLSWRKFPQVSGGDIIPTGKKV